MTHRFLQQGHSLFCRSQRARLRGACARTVVGARRGGLWRRVECGVPSARDAKSNRAQSFGFGREWRLGGCEGTHQLLWKSCARASGRASGQTQLSASWGRGRARLRAWQGRGQRGRRGGRGGSRVRSACRPARRQARPCRRCPGLTHSKALSLSGRGRGRGQRRAQQGGRRRGSARTRHADGALGHGAGCRPSTRPRCLCGRSRRHCRPRACHCRPPRIAILR